MLSDDAIDFDQVCLVKSPGSRWHSTESGDPDAESLKPTAQPRQAF